MTVKYMAERKHEAINFLIEMNLIDSLKSVVSGLQTSSSLTQILLTIDHLIVT